MTKFKRVSLAYVSASVASFAVGLVVTALYVHWTRERVSWWVASAIIWLVIVGGPSLFAAVDDLLKALGKKDKPFISATNFRPLSIDAWRGTTFQSLMPSLATVSVNGQSVQPPSETTEIKSELYDIKIEVGDYVLDETYLMSFLKTVWSRQRNKKPGLSRRWWVEGPGRLERGEYDATIAALQMGQLVAGRKHGRSGKLIYPPLQAMRQLRELVS